MDLRRTRLDMEIEWLYCFLQRSEALQDINWAEEAEVAEELGYTTHSFDFDHFLEGSFEAALDGMPDGRGQTLVYRGWMMKEDEYADFESEMSSRGYVLQTNAYQYIDTLSLPTYFETIEDLTPPALWTWEADIESAWEMAQSLGPGPKIVKDHIKSAKEAWLEACFVPEDADYSQFKGICEELMERRGELFEKGFVVRPFVPLKQLGASWMGFPIFDEYRLIFWKGEMILADAYSDLSGKLPDFSKFKTLGDRIDSPFFVADIARTEAGELILIELNDGGVAGLPPLSHPIDFYQAVAAAEGDIEKGEEIF